MFALDDPWHKDDNIPLCLSLPLPVFLALQHIAGWELPLGEKPKKEIATASWPLSPLEVNLNFSPAIPREAPGTRGSKGWLGARRVPPWSTVICGWKFWICLQPLRAYPFPSVACVSHPRTSLFLAFSPRRVALVVCVFIFSLVMLFPRHNHCCLPLLLSPSPRARFESFKWNIVEIIYARVGQLF